MITPQQLIDEARKLIGTPWRHQGRTTSGVDCIGLVALATRNAGLDLAAVCGVRDERNYGRRADPRLYALVEKHCTRIDAPIPGALLFFKFKGDRAPRHFGIYTERDTVIHAEAKVRGQVVEHGYRAQWVTWTDSIWKLPGVSYDLP